MREQFMEDLLNDKNWGEKLSKMTKSEQEAVVDYVVHKYKKRAVRVRVPLHAGFTLEVPNKATTEEIETEVYEIISKLDIRYIDNNGVPVPVNSVDLKGGFFLSMDEFYFDLGDFELD